MTVTTFVIRNALRNKRRLILTVLSVSISLALFTLLQGALHLLTQDQPMTEQSALRIVTRHKVSLGNVLPEKYLSRIERVPGVAHVSRFTFLGGIYKDASQTRFAQFVVDPDKIFHIFTEIAVTPEAQQAFLKEKNACIVGSKLIERYGWKVGDRLTFQQGIWPCNVEVVIRGVYTRADPNVPVDENMVFIRHDYFDDLLGHLGLVGTFWIRTENAEVIPEVINRIDTMFRNTDAETKTETERAFQLGFVSMMGNVKLFIGSICTVIVFTMLLVTASTMAMAIRERSREIAILKALGFNGAQLFGLIFSESFALAVAGGLLGCVGTKLVMENLNLDKLSGGLMRSFPIAMDAVWMGLAVACILGVVSSLAPAYTSIKTSVVNGLKTLD
jgi:putative ABC transport system permease protein